MSEELKKVEVRLKLTEGNGLYSSESIDRAETAVRVMAEAMAGLDREEVCVVNMDGKGHPINFNVVSIGSLNSSIIPMGNVFKTAILSNAASILILSILVDTFFTRISMPKLQLPESRNISAA